MTPTPLLEEFILSEVRKLQYLYGLKREIRYGLTRAADDTTESVAEHLYGMHLLAHYFLPLENPAGDWNKLRILTMITVHDLDEIETGDTISYLKTSKIIEAGTMARATVIEKTPLSMQADFRIHLEEYEDQQTSESRFVKAIDRIEPLFHSFNDAGKSIFLQNKQTLEQSARIKEPYLKPFPIMYQYYQIIHGVMVEEGYFHSEKTL